MNLSDAPFEQLLRIVAITDAEIERELNRVGLRVGSECHKHVPTNPPSLRIKGPSGSVVLGGGLTSKVTLNVNSGTKTLSDIRFEDTAAVKDIKGGCWLQNALRKLGIQPGAKIRLMRRLPPMEYVVRINNRERIKLSEATAARILGSHEEGQVQQFSSARVETDFTITDLVGGRKFSAFLRGLGIASGEKIVLEGLEHVSELYPDNNGNLQEEGICLKTVRGSVRIHLNNQKATYVEVTTV